MTAPQPRVGVAHRPDPPRHFRFLGGVVNLALEETIGAGLFAHDREVDLDVVHRFNEAAEFLAEVGTWTGTTVPAVLRQRLKRPRSPFDVHEGARLRRLRVL